MLHGGNLFEIQRKCNIDKNSLLDYSANINPLGVPATLKTLITNRINDLEHYPDIYYHELKYAIATYYSLSIEDIFVGNGAAQIIFDSIHTLRPQKSILLAPTFSEYERALKSCNTAIVKHQLKEEENFDLDIDKFIKEIDDSIDLIVLCNPNNPTSRLITTKGLEKILQKSREVNAYLIIDEAFMDFVEDQQCYSMLDKYRDYTNLIIVRAFTKFYGVPGLRLGFGVCRNSGLIEQLHQRMLPWSLNTFAGYFGEVLRSETTYVEKTHQWLQQEKKRFVEELKKIEGLKVFSPSVNFILIKILVAGFDVPQLKQRMLEKNILIRDCSTFDNLDKKFFRIAVKSRIHNEIFTKTLMEVMKQ
ncbi:threonine-phosphate decarboxylase CobD [Natronincola ferrireducens]|uniref:threonine-phosphate decarboxylase n=1 Tax=Natronincola ferrireducens TaxID=393762 RepID=A0A1G9E1D9_9FIRM|nr:threonine-phosphate decarboxylase CobD [Natronincola ferrireducens]SDK69956.1 L-threonine O-3-phosphate decarboxylase [Natronincola ferrireducens]